MRDQSIEAFFGLCVVGGVVVIGVGIASCVARWCDRRGIKTSWH